MAAWRENGRFLRCTACNWTTIPVCSRCEHWASSHPPEDDGCAEAGCGCTEYVGPLSPPAAGPSGGEVTFWDRVGAIPCGVCGHSGAFHCDAAGSATSCRLVGCACVGWAGVAPESPPAAGPRGGEVPPHDCYCAVVAIGDRPCPPCRAHGCAPEDCSALCCGGRVVAGPAPAQPARGGEVPRAIPETPEHLKIRRCKTEVAGDEPDDPPHACDTVLGSDVRCDVCGGLRCAFHCGSIDHLSGAQLISVHSVMLPGGRSLTAKLVRAADGLFWGEVRKLHGSAIYAVPIKVSADDGDDVLRQLHAFMDGFPKAEPPAFEPPRVERAGSMLAIFSSSGDRGDETCSEADLFDPENWEGVAVSEMARALALPSPGAPSTPQRRRLARTMVAEVLSWDRAWAELSELAEVDPRSVARARALHDACVISLLSRLGGEL